MISYLIIILCVDIKYEFYKYIFIIKLHKMFYNNNIVTFDYNIFNFKIYLILKL